MTPRSATDNNSDTDSGHGNRSRAIGAGSAGLAVAAQLRRGPGGRRPGRGDRGDRPSYPELLGDLKVLTPDGGPQVWGGPLPGAPGLLVVDAPGPGGSR
jgi:hypothetical protein